jgi:hypothetical protein
MADTDEQLRAKVDQAMIYAPSKWRSQVGRIATAYAKAYQTQTVVLASIERRKRLEAEFATWLISLILPSLVGGFLGAIVAGKGKQAIDAITDQASKFRWSVAFDTTKTIVSDLAKAEVRVAYQSLFETSGWRPSSISPVEFMSQAQTGIDDFVTAAADALNNSKIGRTTYTYRDILTSLYYGPFIREAPEIQDLWTVDELAPMLEVFLWVDWANHRDTEYWLKRISDVTESHPRGSNLDKEHLQFELDAKELKDLNPILERFDRCGVQREYVTQGMPDQRGYRFLNILWVRQLGVHYRGSLLGDLLERRTHPGHIPVPVSRRPRSYRVM